MFGDSIVNSKNLPLKKLSEISKLKAGKAIITGELENNYKNDYYPCYGGNGLRGYINRFSHEGTLPIIGRQGAWAGNINLACGKFYATEHAIVVTPLIDLNPIWYYYSLKSLNLTRFQSGAAQPGLSVDKIKNIMIPFPQKDKQDEFASFVELIDKLKFSFLIPSKKIIV